MTATYPVKIVRMYNRNLNKKLLASQERPLDRENRKIGKEFRVDAH